MISAKLIKYLEEKGFELEFPNYNSNEELLKTIIKENNQRLNLSIPLILEEKFDYSELKKLLTKEELIEFNNALLITKKIFEKEQKDTKYFSKIINNYKIKQTIREEEFNYFYEHYQDFKKRFYYKKEQIQEKENSFKNTIFLNEALEKLFSPGKIRIMKKIRDYEPLTETELKYYYRSIAPILKALMNNNLRDYAEIILKTKKYRE